MTSQPASTPNGAAAFRPEAASLIGRAVAGALKETLPPMLFQAVAQALSQVPVQTAASQPRWCATCVVQRSQWEAAHKTDMDTALNAAAASAGISPEDPRAGRLDLAAFLPALLRPGQPGGMPPLASPVTAVQGTELCPAHIPGVTAGRGGLLIAQGALSPAMLRQPAA